MLALIVLSIEEQPSFCAPLFHFCMSTPDSPPLFKFTRTFWTGLVFAGLCVPFLVMTQLGRSGSLDLTSEAVGRAHLVTGMLAVMFFLPSILTLAWGSCESLMEHRRAKWRFANPGAARARAKEKAAEPKKFTLPRKFWFGLIFFLGCSGPLLVSLILVKTGVQAVNESALVVMRFMAMFSFIPSIVWMLGAAGRAWLDYKKGAK